MQQGPAAHVVLELLAYTVGGFIYRNQTRVAQAQNPSSLQKFGVIAGAVFGAALGSKLI